MIGKHAFSYLSKICKKNFLKKEKNIMGVAGLIKVYIHFKYKSIPLSTIN